MAECVDGVDCLVAAMAELSVRDLKQGGKHLYGAVAFFDAMNILPRVCQQHNVDYERCVTSLIEGPPQDRRRRR